ncbi:GNAT family N-acetyltransferase [Allomuricauda sp. d1]|uniref:GNAT family N-acetyltransferase n=1 Tax=Allomuricauda sp. d1 TaxID=3136725 RepID=UPI0031D929E7
MNLDLQPTLKNDLVLVRPLAQEDYDELYKVANDPKIWEQHQNPDRWEASVFKEFFKGAIDSKGAFAIIDKKTNKIIGSSRYKISERSPKAVEIGWTFLSRDYWGGHYNKSFKTLMIDRALTHFDHVIFHINENNFRSQKATEKLGGKRIEPDSEHQELRHLDKTALTYIISRKAV